MYLWRIYKEVVTPFILHFAKQQYYINELASDHDQKTDKRLSQLTLLKGVDELSTRYSLSTFGLIVTVAVRFAQSPRRNHATHRHSLRRLAIPPSREIVNPSVTAPLMLDLFPTYHNAVVQTKVPSKISRPQAPTALNLPPVETVVSATSPTEHTAIKNSIMSTDPPSFSPRSSQPSLALLILALVLICAWSAYPRICWRKLRSFAHFVSYGLLYMLGLTMPQLERYEQELKKKMRTLLTKSYETDEVIEHTLHQWSLTETRLLGAMEHLGRVAEQSGLSESETRTMLNQISSFEEFERFRALRIAAQARHRERVRSRERMVAELMVAETDNLQGGSVGPSAL